jgi:hypothetical protein
MALSRRIGVKNALSTAPVLMYQPSLPPLGAGEYRVVERPVGQIFVELGGLKHPVVRPDGDPAFGVARSL